jgi:hypothetical protein
MEARMPNNDQAAKDDQAKRLAQKHYQIEDGITQIFQIKQRVNMDIVRAKPVTLLEINANTIPSGIMPIRFGPNPSSRFKYPSVILEFTPDEFEKIQTHELPLPERWELGELIPRPVLKYDFGTDFSSRKSTY